MATAGEGQVIQGLFAAEEWQRGLTRTNSGSISDCWQNVNLVLAQHPAWEGVLAFDEFSQQPVKLKPAPTGAPAGPWLAQDDMATGMWLQQRVRYTVKSLANISTGALACAQGRRFHPVRDWLSGLVWDGTPRLDHFAEECLGAAPGPYSAAVGRYFLISMVARVMEPGCIMRAVPVLEGAQERGKSTALRTLAGDQWFSDSAIDLASKDAFELIQGVWLYEISEMHAFNRAEATRVKQFISSVRDSWVPKYIRGRITCERQVVFGGTTNEGLYLKDWTGNTRFWPLRCEVAGEISVQRIGEWREQLFAEARARYEARERRFPSAEEYRELFEPQQSERLIEHPWQGPIVEWLDMGTFERVTVNEVLHEACKVEVPKMTLAMQQDVGRIMASLGWVRRREPTGARRWFYHRPASTAQRQDSDAGAENAPF